MHECEHIQKVSAYHDGELSTEEARVLKVHLVQCPVCAQELREVKKLSSILGKAVDFETPAKVIKRLHQSVAIVQEASVTTLAKMLTAAAAAILIVCAAWLWSMSKSDASSPTVSLWERTAVTLGADTTNDVQQIAHWIVEDLSSERRHD